MRESRELQLARRLLADGEARLASAEGLDSLTEGVALLDDVAAAADGREARTASNLAASYASRIYARIGERLARDRQVPEPELERYFKAVLAFDTFSAALPLAASELKVEVAKALVERYYEGHPPERKRAALAQLAEIRRGR
jgi:hypothetical protein